jgi:uncharacterized protein
MLNQVRLNQIGYFLLTLLGSLFLSVVYSVGHASASTDPEQKAPAVDSSVDALIPKPISETKRQLIYQLLELMNGRQQYEQMQQLILASMQQQIQPMMEQLANNNPELSAAEKEALISELSSNADSLITQFSAALRAEVTYDMLLERVYYPVYDQYFTEADLSDLIAFYQSPVGIKLTAVSPQLMQTSFELSNQVFIPRATEILNRLLKQQVAPE